MNRLLRQFALPLMFLGAFICSGCHGSSSATSSASSGAANGTYMICYATSSAHGIKVSSVFHVPPVDQVTMLEEPWAKEFRTYVGQSGDEGGISVTCTQVDPKNPDAALKDQIDAWKKQGTAVTQVNWKYAG